MNKIKFLALSTMVLFLFSVQSVSVATGGNTFTSVRPNVASDVTIAIVYSTGGLGDLGFNDAAEIGIDTAVADWNEEGITVTVDEACQSQCDLTDVTTNIETFASSSVVYDLIIGIGFSSLDGINASALAHTDRNFMLIDEKIVLPNVWSITFKEHEGSFLAGAMAAMISESDDIAFLGGLDIPLINRFLAGFEHGARTITPDIVVRAQYSPDPTNPWGDLEGGKTIAKKFIAKGSDVVFAAAGGTGIGSINGVIEHNEDNADDKVWAIGVDGDQDAFSEGNVLTSMVKAVDLAVIDQINATVMDTWASAQENRGIKEGGVRISSMAFTQTQANADFDGTQSNIEKVRALEAQVVAGTLIVREFVGDSVAGQDINFGSIDEDDAPLPTIPVLLAISMAVLVIRRKRN
ncbi:MAG: Membrane lipoprotein TmpC precursor [Candidatus Heimdallarchaeota archaeon LC_2]|nr:MAG: Membrane lipoprotein TmpC precursor [Candidatus Heimdallarchaeota archaeon LC_2]